VIVPTRGAPVAGKVEVIVAVKVTADGVVGIGLVILTIPIFPVDFAVASRE
jgi:hypothetical protein